MERPIVSIITPAYNCINTIKETFESIKAQSFCLWEWIVVEDNSSDGSFDYISKLVGTDKRVKLLRTPINSGAAVARNIGIEKASGRFIAFLDSDDLYKPEKLEKQIYFMQKNDFAFSFTDYDVLLKNGTIKQHRIKRSKIDYKTLLKSNYIGCLTVIYDAKKLGKIYMPIDCEKREDHGAWLDIVRDGTCAYRLNESLSIYRLVGSSVSSNKAKMMKYQYRLYRNHERFSVLKSCFYVVLCSLHKVFNKY